MEICLCDRNQDAVCVQCRNVLFGRTRSLIQLIREYQEKISELQSKFHINCERCFMDYGDVSASCFISELGSYPESVARLCMTGLVQVLHSNGVEKFPHITLEWNKVCAKNGWSP